MQGSAYRGCTFGIEVETWAGRNGLVLSTFPRPLVKQLKSGRSQLFIFPPTREIDSPTNRFICSACALISYDAEADSSALEAFFWTTLSILMTSLLIWSIPCACS